MKNIILSIIFIAGIIFLIVSNRWIMQEIKETGGITETVPQQQAEAPGVPKNTARPLQSTSPLVEPDVPKDKANSSMSQDNKKRGEVIYEPPLNDVILIQ